MNFSNGVQYWKKQLFIKKSFGNIGCSPSNEHFKFVSGIEVVFEPNSGRKNLFLSACYCWDSNFPFVRWTKNLNLMELLVMMISFGVLLSSFQSS